MNKICILTITMIISVIINISIIYANDESKIISNYHQSHVKNSWFIGFGFGVGNGSVIEKDEVESTYTYIDKNNDRIPFSGFFRIGAILNPKFHLGSEIALLTQQTNQYENVMTLSQGSIMLSAYYFPINEGPFAKCGAGFSFIGTEIKREDTEKILSENNDVGLAANIGLGYAFWLGESFNLTINGDLFYHYYAKDTESPLRSLFYTISVGCEWF